jgi:hypothetical protein
LTFRPSRELDMALDFCDELLGGGAAAVGPEHARQHAF